MLPWCYLYTVVNVFAKLLSPGVPIKPQIRVEPNGHPVINSHTLQGVPQTSGCPQLIG